MNETIIRQEVYRLLRTSGYWPVRGRDATLCPRCGMEFLPSIGRPDILVLAPFGLNRVVEVKIVSGASFPLDKLTDQQRSWLAAWMEEGGYGYIAIGTADRPRKLWIVDYVDWLDMESRVRAIQASVPVDVESGRYRIAMRDAGLGLVQLFSKYELFRKAGAWQLPEDHSLTKMWGTNG